MTNLFNYIDKPSPIHRLTGATKFAALLLWNIAAMVTFDTRYLLILSALSIAVFSLSKITIKDISFMLGFTVFFLIFNNVLLYIFTPDHGTDIYGTCHIILGSGHYALTKEMLFYYLNYFLKYLSTIPIILLFICTTNPSEFAASLSALGVPYQISYSVALALRYIPDIHKEFIEISKAQQARGIEMSKKERPFKRVKSACSILIPLILSSMDRIEVISNAMELRGFGKNKKRSWYMGRKFSKWDIISIVFCILLAVITFVLIAVNGSRYWNPFVL